MADLFSESRTLTVCASLADCNSLMRDYFASLGDSAHPHSNDPRARAITRFQELLLISFREFSVITDETILAERRKFRSEVIQNIESFSKRAAIRSLKTMERFTKEQVGLIYDAIFRAICIKPPPATALPPVSLIITKDGSEERPETRIGLDTFKVFLSEIVTWAREDKIVSNGFKQRVDREVADHELIDRLFFFWDIAYRGALSFQASQFPVPLQCIADVKLSGSGFRLRRCDVQRSDGEYRMVLQPARQEQRRLSHQR